MSIISKGTLKESNKNRIDANSFSQENSSQETNSSSSSSGLLYKILRYTTDGNVKKYKVKHKSKIDNEIEKDVQDEIDAEMTKTFGKCLYNMYKKNSKNLLCLLNMNDRTFKGRRKRIMMIVLSLLWILYGAVPFYFAHKDYNDDKEYGLLYLSFNITVEVICIIMLLLIFIIWQLENIWFGVILFLSLVYNDIQQIYRTYGFLDMPLISINSIVVLMAVFCYTSSYSRIFWIIVYNVNTIIMACHEGFSWNINRDPLFKEVLTPDSSGVSKILSNYAMNFLSVNVSLILYFVKSSTERSRYKKKKKARKKQIEKMKIVEDELEILIADKKSAMESGMPQLKINKNLFQIDNNDINLIKKIGRGGSEGR